MSCLSPAGCAQQQLFLWHLSSPFLLAQLPAHPVAWPQKPTNPSQFAGWSPRQQQVMSNLLRIRAVAQQYILRQEVERTTEFLWAASQGSEAKVRQMLQQGAPPDSADYGEWAGWASGWTSGWRAFVDASSAACTSAAAANSHLPTAPNLAPSLASLSQMDARRWSWPASRGMPGLWSCC